jgi:hypothetical protein
MNHANEIKAMHLRELYRQMGWFSGIAVRDVYLRLSPGQRSKLAQYGHQLREYIDELGDGPVDQALLEMACLIPGAMRGKPSFMADQTPETRPMYASELREGREWLLLASKLAAILRKLTPDQWGLLLCNEDASVSSRWSADATSDIVLEALDGVLPDTSGTEFMNLEQALCAAYARLSEAEGRELAHFALGLSTLPLPGALDIVEDVVVHVACFMPDALKDLHYQFARRQIFSYRGVLYRGANAKTSKLLVKKLDEGRVSKQDLNSTLVAVAWIGDEAVRSAFRRWQIKPPPWRAQLYVSPADYAHEAGWELTDSGERRSLVSEVCYPMVPSEHNQGPVSTITPGEAKCGDCGRGLVTLLDLDLADARLAFLGIHGERLRVATCDRCGLYSQAYFTEIDLQGRSDWSSLNEGSLDGSPDVEPFYSAATRKLVLGRGSKGPLESLVCWEGSSQIGGYPGWVQDAAYPKCPECGQTMKFIGQLATDDFMGQPAEGTTFCLICPQYHIAATVYQQT